MKNFKTAAISFVITAGFFCSILCMVGIFLLPAQIGTTVIQADENLSGIDYSNAPEPISLKVFSESQGGVVLYLNFKTVNLDVYLFENSDDIAELQTDYYIECPEYFLGLFCDRIGGIALENSGQEEVYFGAAIEQYCAKDLSIYKMQEISSAFFEKISKTGLSSDDFKFIIKNTQTDLNYPVCYDMMEYVSQLFENYNFR